MVFQEPMAAFDPVFTIGDQITESIVQHKLATKAQASERAVELLRRVGIPEPELRMKQYPNELSGGMLQRAMIAMALACGPELLIADEPTTALDVTIQAQILQPLRELQEEFHMAILLITHDLGIAAEMADRIVVMYAGEVVEEATSRQLFEHPHHPYTKGLLQSITTMDSDRSAKLYAIEGSIPNLAESPTGAAFIRGVRTRPIPACIKTRRLPKSMAARRPAGTRGSECAAWMEFRPQDGSDLGSHTGGTARCRSFGGG
ncbi:ABC transporter ATP-binding protein [Paenibacillus sp. P26]|nr:ABC transporter ATP-binding protein [Paenibacillus sp. P26]